MHRRGEYWKNRMAEVAALHPSGRRLLPGSDQKFGSSTLMDTSCSYQFATVFSIKKTQLMFLNVSLLSSLVQPYNLYYLGGKCFQSKEMLDKQPCLWLVVQALLFEVIDKALVLMWQTQRKRVIRLPLLHLSRRIFFKRHFVYGLNITGSGQWAQAPL